MKRRTGKMKRLTNTAVLLTIAAALATTVISCSSDDYLTEQPAEQPTAEPQTVHVTVGAGFADDNNGSGTPSTRSAVVTDGTARKLTFTAGDRLYVRGEITETSPQKIVAGYLDIVGTLASGATTATFSGDLSVYEYNSSTAAYENSSHTFTTDDPLSECSEADGVLVHKDAVGFFVDDEKYGEYTTTTASSVDALMTQSLSVYGFYNSSGKQFIFSVYDYEYSGIQYCTPIFNCIISGLKPNTTYDVTHIYKTNFEKAIDGHGSGLGAVTSDADGKATFACYGVCKKAENYHILNFISSDKSDDRNVYLGTKALTSKVYNITKMAISGGVLPGVFSVASGTTVKFSQGNLQYIGSATTPYWKFADNQYDYLGTTTVQNSSDTGKDRDLFGWATSGYHTSTTTDATYDATWVHYQPWATSNSEGSVNKSINNYEYGPSTNNIATNASWNGDTWKVCDWGHNAILNGGNTADTWRTLTSAEWLYLFGMESSGTDTSGHARYRKYFRATVNSVQGIVVLPDDIGGISNIPEESSRGTASTFGGKTYTKAEWTTLEAAGCVFLPAAGKRKDTTVDEVGSLGVYWSSTAYGIYNAYSLYFNSSSMLPARVYGARYFGYSVRLVRNVE